jgi:hypothetical protein
MMTGTEKFAPYAPSASVLIVVRRLRERSLPNPLTAQELTRLSISEGLANRTLRALSFLGLIDEEGHRTATFERLGKASSNEYPELLGEILKEAYKDVFTIIDPAEATDIQINDAFRLYEPHAQRSRMINLFRGLCQEAGLMAGEPPQSVKRSRITTSKPMSQSNGVKRPKPEPKDTEFESVPYQVSIPQASQPVTATPITSTPEYVIMHGVLNKLPFTEKRWTQAEREKWLKAIAANVDMLFELKDPQTDMGMEEDIYRP